MARVFANASHQYTHFEGGGRVYGFNAGEWCEVPDDVADVVCAAHPEKLVRLKPGENRPVEPEPVAEPAAEPVAEKPPKPKIVLFRSVRKKKP